MRYEGPLFRPPSEARSYILQATIGCSWNHCVYCDMYRSKRYRVRPLEECLEDLEAASRAAGDRVDKIFIADGDALGMPATQLGAILDRARELFPRLRRVSCYATAINVLEKTEAELAALAVSGLSLLYMGPESGDDVTLKKIAKGSTFDDHVRAAARARAAGLSISAIFLLGIAGAERSLLHASESARLVTGMDPAFVSALTTTVVPGTPLATLTERGRFVLPSVPAMLRELRVLVDEARPTAAVFRTNHASNYLPLGGVLPADRERIVELVDAALAGRVRLRAESTRGL